MIQWIKEVFEKAMTIPDYNSRLWFAMNSLVCTTLLIVVVFGFVLSNNRVDYIEMTIILASGGSLGASLGRFLTKKSQTNGDNGGGVNQ